MLSVEFDWLNKNRSELFKYRGEYVAVIGTEIVSHSRDLRVVVKETKGKYSGVIPHISKIPEVSIPITKHSKLKKEEETVLI